MQLPNPPPIYLDYHATPPVDLRVAAVVLHAMTTAFGNANSAEHVCGEVVADLVTDTPYEVAALVNADPEGVHFTYGSSAVCVSLSRMLLPVGGRGRMAVSEYLYNLGRARAILATGIVQAQYVEAWGSASGSQATSY